MQPEPAPSADTHEEAAPPEEAVREWLADAVFGEVRPILVRVERAPDADDRDAWFFDVELPNPATDDGWPAEDVMALHLATRDKALEVGLEWPWYVRLHPQFDDEPDDEDREPT